MESFPIHRHHTPADVEGRVALHEEGNWDGGRAAGEDDRLPAMTTMARQH